MTLNDKTFLQIFHRINLSFYINSIWFLTVTQLVTVTIVYQSVEADTITIDVTFLPYSPVKDTVVTNDRWGGVMCQHGDFWTCHDGFNPGLWYYRTVYHVI